MGYEIFSDEWARHWGEQVKQNMAYRTAAASWEWPLVLLIERDPSVGITEDRGVYLDLYHGECREARAATKHDIEQVPFVIQGDAYTWVEVLRGKLEAISTIMRGKLRLTKGNMSTLAGYVLAAQELVKSAQGLESVYPEGLA